MEEKKTNRNRRVKRIAAFILVPLLILISGWGLYFYLHYKETHISTDDAFIDGRIYVVASKISGTVKALYVNDNQFVKKSDLVIEIDPTDYDVRVREARFRFPVRMVFPTVRLDGKIA